MRILSSLLFLFVFVCGVFGQTPIPNRPDGYASPNGGGGDSPVIIDIFIDLLCPDSKAVWPTIKNVINSYNGEVRLVTHLFPLPYHTWAFIVNQGTFVIDTNTKHNLSSIYAYFDFAFAIQDQFSNAATSTLTAPQVISQLSTAVEKVGILSAQTFTAGINNGNINWNQRVAWKYACSRAITGTPTFLINGVFINADLTWTVSQWKSVIDPILAANSLHYSYVLKTFADPQCLNGTTPCEYLPGQSQCCTSGEYCILNVGCRC